MESIHLSNKSLFLAMHYAAIVSVREWNSNPNIFSEIIELQENGGSEDTQTQIPNWPF